MHTLHQSVHGGAGVGVGIGVARVRRIHEIALPCLPCLKCRHSQDGRAQHRLHRPPPARPYQRRSTHPGQQDHPLEEDKHIPGRFVGEQRECGGQNQRQKDQEAAKKHRTGPDSGGITPPQKHDYPQGRQNQHGGFRPFWTGGAVGPTQQGEVVIPGLVMQRRTACPFRAPVQIGRERHDGVRHTLGIGEEGGEERDGHEGGHHDQHRAMQSQHARGEFSRRGVRREKDRPAAVAPTAVQERENLCGGHRGKNDDAGFLGGMGQSKTGACGCRPPDAGFPPPAPRAGQGRVDEQHEQYFLDVVAAVVGHRVGHGGQQCRPERRPAAQWQHQQPRQRHHRDATEGGHQPVFGDGGIAKRARPRRLEHRKGHIIERRTVVLFGVVVVYARIQQAAGLDSLVRLIPVKRAHFESRQPKGRANRHHGGEKEDEYSSLVSFHTDYLTGWAVGKQEEQDRTVGSLL